MFTNTLESEVRDLRRAVERYGKDNPYQPVNDKEDKFALAIVAGFLLFLILI